jgi:DNA adenine methylase
MTFTGLLVLYGKSMVRSPFRYPGAKGRLLPLLDPYIAESLAGCTAFADVFTGGGSVALHVAAKHPKLQIILNDKHPGMYRFWRAVAQASEDDFESTLEVIRTIKPSLDNFHEIKAQFAEEPTGVVMFVLNRWSHSGMCVNPIGGKNQSGKWTVGCRWNPSRHVVHLREIRELLRDRTQVFNLDFTELISSMAEGTSFYLDPPYYRQGPNLYAVSMLPDEHAGLAECLHSRGNWVLSYDDAPEVRVLFKDFSITTIPARYSINGKKLSWNNMHELVITPKKLISELDV